MLVLAWVLRHHNSIYINSGYFHQLGVQRSVFDNPFYLNNDLAAAIMYSLCDGGCLNGRNLVAHDNVAVFIRIGTADKADVQRDRLVEELFLTEDFHNLYQILFGNIIELAALQTGVRKGVQTHMGNGADPVPGNVAIELRESSLREVVALDLVLQNQFPQLRHHVPVPADDASGHSLVGKMVGAAAVPVSLGGRIEKSQALR